MDPRTFKAAMLAAALAENGFDPTTAALVASISSSSGAGPSQRQNVVYVKRTPLKFVCVNGPHDMTIKLRGHKVDVQYSTSFGPSVRTTLTLCKDIFGDTVIRPSDDVFKCMFGYELTEVDDGYSLIIRENLFPDQIALGKAITKAILDAS